MSWYERDQFSTEAQAFTLFNIWIRSLVGVSAASANLQLLFYSTVLNYWWTQHELKKLLRKNNVKKYIVVEICVGEEYFNCIVIRGGLRQYFMVYPNSRHNTVILNYLFNLPIYNCQFGLCRGSFKSSLGNKRCLEGNIATDICQNFIVREGLKKIYILREGGSSKVDNN